MANISATRIATTDRASTSLPDASDLLVKGRAELKYSVPGPIADTALQIARGYLRPDTFALGPQQIVTSLYLDTAHLTFLRWHDERAVDRFKLRIRRYGDDAAPALYAEVKRKTGSVVRKHRAPFPADALHAVLNASVSRVLSDPALDEFIRYRSHYAAMPVMLVTCIRESLRDPKDGTAVTVDRDLRYQSTSRGDLIGEGRAWRSIPLPDSSGTATALLEVKYALDPEPWMGTLIEQLAPWRVSFSKYATAMTASAAC